MQIHACDIIWLQEIYCSVLRCVRNEYNYKDRQGDNWHSQRTCCYHIMGWSCQGSHKQDSKFRKSTAGLCSTWELYDPRGSPTWVLLEQSIPTRQRRTQQREWAGGRAAGDSSHWVVTTQMSTLQGFVWLDISAVFTFCVWLFVTKLYYFFVLPLPFKIYARSESLWCLQSSIRFLEYSHIYYLFRLSGRATGSEKLGLSAGSLPKQPCQ